MAGCSLCNVTFQCRAQTVKSHESSSSHQKKGTAWMLTQEDRAWWQEGGRRLTNRAAEYTAQGDRRPPGGLDL
eukprot:1159333-Pelagomonas_calceolata.AAC.6